MILNTCFAIEILAGSIVPYSFSSRKRLSHILLKKHTQLVGILNNYPLRSKNKKKLMVIPQKEIDCSYFILVDFDTTCFHSYNICIPIHM